MTPGLMKPVAKAPKPPSLISDLLMSIKVGVGNVRGSLVPGAVMTSGQGIKSPCFRHVFTTSPLHLQHPEDIYGILSLLIISIKNQNSCVIIHYAKLNELYIVYN